MKGGCIDLDEMLSEIAVLKKQNKSLGERCLQLQKDKGKLIDYNKKLLQENTDQHNKIVLLSKKVNDLQKENAKVEEIKANADYQLEGRDNEIKELKEQLQWERDTKAELAEYLGKANDKIEKMKCCYNCSKRNDGQCADIPNSSYYSADFVCEDWEMKENE